MTTEALSISAEIPEAIRIFQELTVVPTAPFYEASVTERALSWLRKNLGRSVRVSTHRGGVLVRYVGAGKAPALALAAHLDHPGFHLSAVTAKGAKASLQGGLRPELLPGAAIEAFAARPADNRPAASGVLGRPVGDVYPVTWTQAPALKTKPVFAILSLTPCTVADGWCQSRSIDDLMGVAISLETLRRVAAQQLKTNVTVLLHRAEEVGFIGALELIRARQISPDDSILSIETSKALPDAVPGQGPVIRTGDKSCAFDANLLALLDASADRLRQKGASVQRTRLTGGSCEGTAYLAFGYEAAGVAIPLVNYHNGGDGKVEPEMVRLSDAEGAVQLLVDAARAFPEATLRGRIHARLVDRHKKLAPLLR
ncbi:MAG: M28 family peptidase [Elusimicrobia bacterium]|nr:M28 family peptidase [Elusimicrobiota bacterium]